MLWFIGIAPAAGTEIVNWSEDKITHLLFVLLKFVRLSGNKMKPGRNYFPETLNFQAGIRFQINTDDPLIFELNAFMFCKSSILFLICY